jgi:hypothetical protein
MYVDVDAGEKHWVQALKDDMKMKWWVDFH